MFPSRTVLWASVLNQTKEVGARELHWSEIVLLIFGAVLTAGLVGEYLEHKSDWWKRKLKVFEMCVIIGVLGELLADGAIFSVTQRLQELSDREVATLNKKADDANALAKGYESQIESAKKDATKAVQGAIQNALDLAAQQRKTEELGAKVADRTIPADERKKLVACLAQRPGHVEIKAISDAEAIQYAEQWYQLFSDAKWDTTDPSGMRVAIVMIGGEFWTGVRVDLHGSHDDATRVSRFDRGGLEQRFLECLDTVSIPGITYRPLLTQPAGTINFVVSARPTPKN